MSGKYVLMRWYTDIIASGTYVVDNKNNFDDVRWTYLNRTRSFAVIIESVNEDFSVGVVVVHLRKQQVTITIYGAAVYYSFCRKLPSSSWLYVQSRHGLNIIHCGSGILLWIAHKKNLSKIGIVDTAFSFIPCPAQESYRGERETPIVNGLS